MKPVGAILPILDSESVQNPADGGEMPGNTILNACPNCAGRAYVQMAGVQALQPCPECDAGRAEQSRILDLRFRNSRLPEKYRDASLATWHKDLKPEQIGGKLMARAALQEFYQHRGRVSMHRLLSRIPVQLPHALQTLLEQPDDERSGVALYGAYGTGKTQMASGCINDLRASGVDAIYARVQDILSEARATWGNRSESDVAVISRYRDVDVLLIDDFNLTHDDRQSLKPYELAYAEDLMRYRNAHHKPTIITCNVPPERFVAQWGERTGEVVLELCHWIKVGGAKLRPTQQPLEGVTL